MSEITIYGIKNCDTMKKAMKYCDAKGISYTFHDYKKQPPIESILMEAIAQHGWEKVINKRGTTWRKLDDDVKNNVSNENAVALAMENPSMIKRPLLVKGASITLGFSPDIYDALLG